MKHKRQKKIIEIIASYDIETQDALIDKLRSCGFDVTQATVSRDIKELGLIKAAAKDNKYRYAIPSLPTQENNRISIKYRNIIREAIVRVDYAENIVVIKTYAGMAQAAAAAIDGFGWDDIVGCIAGDDTILIILRSADKSKEIYRRFQDTINLN
ncbi:MAG: arginine repressor [Eubacteriales bacterium]|jgi:transcriptional regulator of arginine metabolism|nr:arginine repressor [Eubacteriales bacterium]